jgi:hypothetical protein
MKFMQGIAGEKKIERRAGLFYGADPAAGVAVDESARPPDGSDQAGRGM